MKTTKKGFTLIELIVVIAIIGVLAAILVPAMLGYVKKSKIQSANSAAATMLKAANSALTEMDEVDMELGDGYYGNTTGAAQASDLWDYMKAYADGFDQNKICIYVDHQVAIACAFNAGTYVGTNPTYFTNKNYPSGTVKLKRACEAAISKYNSKHGTEIEVTAAPTDFAN